MILKRSIFPLSKITVCINGEDILLSPKGKKNYYLKEVVSKYNIEVKTPLLFGKTTIETESLTNSSTIYIKSSISDKYYLIGGAISLLFCILLFFDMMPILIFSLVLLLYFIPIIYFTFIKPNKYFVIEIN
ncbi:hypothetical protein CGC48_06500 [Capnocytophaga cynodegmi]|uniref:Uncharacterized protein n=1 Tax=Capnocytophaga cynodegmi TaxID=28189 RepID=A0A250E983_9FLAO|nr:hypothetical protein [Capnocytophaga cynodegmi]ATA68308.1 hypothetical protein CGC48_06500 [Capnocytophaga cynodegmi]